MNKQLQLLSDWQHGFALSPQPFAHIAHQHGLSEAEVLAHYRQAQAEGALSRIGGVFAPAAGGDSLLAAMAVPSAQLDAVAAMVSRHPGVNHNYAREHRINLWFVMTGPSREQVEHSLQALERESGLRILRLRLQRPYRIDLGFALGPHASRPALRPDAHIPAATPAHAHRPRSTPAQPIAPRDHALAALAEQGLPLTPRPYAAWAEQLGRSEAEVLTTLAGWLTGGQLQRFGVVVRHHELGYAANAMTVFDVPDDRADACGQALAAQPGVTLAYRRNRDPAWPYNLYAMVHGQERQAVLQVINRVSAAAGLDGCARQVLFSTTRYKQTGARRFAAWTPQTLEPAHAVCG